MALQDGELLLVGQKSLLRSDNIEVADEAAFVPAGGDIQIAAGCINRLLLRLEGLIENHEAGKAILNFTDRKAPA